MQKLCRGLLALFGVLSSSSLHAADLPLAPNPVRAEAAWNWTGFYIGAHGGMAWSRDNSSSNPPVAFNAPINSRGYLFGGHAGYSWQYGMLVGGLEVDMSVPHLRGSTTGVVAIPGVFGITTTSTRSLSYDYLGTARARVGVVPWQNVVLYGTGGLAWTKITQTSESASVSAFATTSFSSSMASSLFGFVVGGGAEAALGNFGLSNMLVRFEYLHYDFGKQNSTTSVAAGPDGSFTNGLGPLRVDVFRGGLTLKF